MKLSTQTKRGQQPTKEYTRSIRRKFAFEGLFQEPASHPRSRKIFQLFASDGGPGPDRMDNHLKDHRWPTAAGLCARSTPQEPPSAAKSAGELPAIPIPTRLRPPPLSRSCGRHSQVGETASARRLHPPPRQLRGAQSPRRQRGMKSREAEEPFP